MILLLTLQIIRKKIPDYHLYTYQDSTNVLFGIGSIGFCKDEEKKTITINVHIEILPI